MSGNQGDTMKVTISGSDVLTQPVTLTAGPLALTLKAADGSTGTLTLPEPVVVSSGLVATVTIGGVSYTYSQASGLVQQPYVDPGRGGPSQFTMASTLCINSGLPNVNVLFRQDTAGTQGRAECIIELTNALATSAADIATGYTLMIAQGSTTLFTAPVPAHPWGTSIRVASNAGGPWSIDNPRPVTRTVAQLQASGYIPTYSSAGIVGPDTPVPSAQTYALFGPAGFATDMGETGDRFDIGLFTDWQADYMLTGDLLSTIFAQAEAIRSWNIVLRDPDTHAPIDLAAYSKANTISGNGGPLIHLTTYKYPYGTGTPMSYDRGHSPDASYLTFLLTGDVYYLESLQFQMDADIIQVGWQYRWTQSGRYLGWPLRNMIEAYVATPADAPNWLLSKAQILSLINEQYTAIQTAMKLPVCQTLGFYVTSETDPGQNEIAVWQQDYLSIDASFAVFLINNGLLAVDPSLSSVPLAFATMLANNGMVRISTQWNQSYPSWYDSVLAPLVGLAASIKVGDTSIQVAATIGTATEAAIAAGGPDSTATPQSVFPAPPFEVSINGHLFTITANVGTTWQLAAPSTVAITVGTGTVIVWGSTALTWAAQLTLQSAVQGFGPSTGNLEAATPGGWVYFAILRCALAMSKAANIASADPTWLNGQMNYATLPSPQASFAANLDEKWDIGPT